MANRRSFIAGLLAVLALPIFGRSKEQMNKYVITFPRDIKAEEPIEVEAKDRAWAMASLGATVWTAEEWKEVNAKLGKKEHPNP